MGWKEASSLILMALKDKPYTSLFNYKMLMLKRSDKSSFMPNGIVFPGGAVDSEDSTLKWLDLFAKHGVSTSSLSRVVDEKNLPPICKQAAADEVVLAKEISLRVTAIREAFEETGILLCRTADGVHKTSPWTKVLSSAQLSAWRPQVQKTPSKFLDLCDSLQCIPDIWGLKLWSNWLTPPDFQKRFDTVFYTACLSEEPEGSADKTEIEELSWYSPDRLLSLSLGGKLWLPPPQLYELSRIMRFCMLEDLADYAAAREIQGCERYGTSRLKTKEGLIFPLPGDGAYGEVDLDRFSDCDFAEARQLCHAVHRLEIFRDYKCRIAVSNVTPTYGHLLPLTQPKVISSQCCMNK